MYNNISHILAAYIPILIFFFRACCKIITVLDVKDYNHATILTVYLSSAAHTLPDTHQDHTVSAAQTLEITQKFGGGGEI